MPVGLAGLIYAAIVVAWAAYLVPLWLRRHDEESAARSVDRFSTEMRVLARRRSAGSASDPSDASDSSDSSDSSDPSSADPASPGSAGAFDSDPLPISAATRRRRAFVGLLVVTTICLGLAVMALLPWWAVGVTGALDAAFLLMSARASASERARVRAFRRRAAASAVRAELAGESAAESVAEPAVVVAELPEEYREGASGSPDDGTWEPREVPLPTYVTKPKAPAPTARRIELGSSESFTSARFSSAESEALLDESERAPTGIQDELFDRDQYDDFDERRVVGD